MLKRGVDLVVCIVALPVAGVLMALIALAIAIDTPGPILFVQRRTGRDGVRFPMLKFRTMVENAEELKASLQHLSIVPAPDFKVIDDPRITRVGRVLRATSLDELPQLLNVLVGHMSLVGPRPTSFAPATYSLWHTRRLEVRPGLTGLWQVQGRTGLSFDERLRLDVRYIDHCCLPVDLWILAATVRSVVQRGGE
ncbi:sugar transferase [Iamia sp. SCSIO 61187]|uniref:sugar transferase n=1 Tax=Iamia sp. SCSIO 61187 TaxID=2722752 RepID=UPI001C637A9B|nr:sugar transferase [Iamia sp. SCSIO 61187]QYG92243.1 sugar transferase [Iamia sp. SCSIO 61187]